MIIKKISKIKKIKNFNQIKTNKKIILKVKYTKKMHDNFAILSGDTSPIHQKKSFSKKFGYKNLLGYGFFINVILSNILGMIFPGGNDLCINQISNFKKPFFINDTLFFYLTTVNKNKKNKVLNINIEVTNQKKEKIFFGSVISFLKFL